MSEQKEKIPCKAVEMMIEPEYCNLISNNGKECDCEERKKLLEAQNRK